MTRKIWIFLTALLIIGSLVVGLLFRHWIWGPNVKSTLKSYEFYVPTGSSASYVFEKLKNDGWLINTHSYEWVARAMHYDKDKVPPGRYVLKPGMSNRQLVSKLRAGKQTPVNITYNNVRYVEDLAGKIAHYIEEDSLSIVRLLQDQDFCLQRGLDTHTIMTLFIPNTYEFYWNTTALQLIRRMEKEHARFWGSENRLEKARNLGLEPAEVFTLASIVEKETLFQSEKARIAGVYLNRLKTGMLLQADPTVVYAVGDFSIRRVLNRHLEVDSPYNTYKYPGLPPGPICMPDIGTIDAVLNAEEHEYIFFCAKPETNGKHAFAKTLRGHMQNARAYQNWLRSNRIK
jgi:UPF0755 protein